MWPPQTRCRFNISSLALQCNPYVRKVRVVSAALVTLACVRSLCILSMVLCRECVLSVCVSSGCGVCRCVREFVSVCGCGVCVSLFVCGRE